MLKNSKKKGSIFSTLSLFLRVFNKIIFVRKLLYILLLLSFGQLSYALPIMLSDSTGDYVLAKNISVFEDISASLDIEDVISHSKEFSVLETANINLGFTNSAYWIKIPVHNPTYSSKNLILNVAYPFLSDVFLYTVEENSVVGLMKNGLNVAGEELPVKKRHNVFPLSVEPQKSKVFYIRIFNAGNTIDAPLKLMTYETFIIDNDSNRLFLGLYFGAILFVLIFNLFYYYVLKERINKYYTLYVVAASFYVFNLSGLGTQYVFTSIRYMSFIITAFSIPLTNFCLLSFSSNFLDVKSFSKKLQQVIDWLRYINLSFVGLFAIILLFSLRQEFTLPVLTTLSTIVNFAVLFFAAIMSVKHKIQHSRYFLSAFVFGFIGLLVFVFKQMGFIPDTFFIRHSLHLSFLAETLVFFFAFLHRIRNQRQQQQALLVERSLKIEQQKEKLVDANFELAKLSVIAQKTDNGIVVFNKNRQVLWLNESYSNIHQYASDLLSEDIFDVYGDQVAVEAFKNSLETQEPVRFNTNRMVDDQMLYIQTNLTPIINPDGELSVVAVDSNVTKLIEIQQELEDAKDKAEQANKLKTAIMTNVSHELRTPLNAIIGFSDLLTNKNFEEKRRKEFVQLINVNGKKLLEHIEGFLDIVKIESGYVSVFYNKFDLNALIRDLYQHFDITLSEQERLAVELKYQTALPDVFVVYSDKEIVKQIFSNLISNALKFTTKGSVVFGYATTTDNRLNLFVKDTGIGLTDDKAQLALESFRQVDNSLTREFGGTGLGLSIVNGLVKLLDGELHIIGKENVGTQVIVSLPNRRIK